jgi:hypothetical protein
MVGATAKSLHVQDPVGRDLPMGNGNEPRQR